jgi:hypothetical protein
MTFPLETLHQTQDNIASHVTSTNTFGRLTYLSVCIFAAIYLKVVYKLGF